MGIFPALGKYSVISADPSSVPWSSEQKAVGAPQPCQVLPPTGCVASCPAGTSYCLLCSLVSASDLVSAKFGSDTQNPPGFISGYKQKVS